MKTYETFKDGPVYVDLNIGESFAHGTAMPIKLLNIGYQGPVGKPGRAELGWLKVAIGKEIMEIPLGWWRVIGGIRIAAELNAVYNSEPIRKQWEKDYWRLEYDGRLMLSDNTKWLANTKKYVFPIVSDAWSWGYTHNWLSKYSGTSGLNPTHFGVDIDCPVGVGKVQAAIGGEIVYVGGYKEPDEIGSEGIVVSIIGEDGLGYLYCHMSATGEAIKEGNRIPTGYSIGLSGQSGFENTNTTPHLHFEMVWGDSRGAITHLIRPPWFDVSRSTVAFYVNPLPYLFQWFEDYISAVDGLTS